jgi:hypothetical protein
MAGSWGEELMAYGTNEEEQMVHEKKLIADRPSALC